MIDELHVTNVALIADATVEPCSGLTVLTGETGAGKSALLSSIKLLVGDRASGDQVRDGAEGLSVEGRLFFSSDAGEFPDGHVAQRRVTAEGRSRCSIDGSMAVSYTHLWCVWASVLSRPPSSSSFRGCFSKSSGARHGRL